MALQWPAGPWSAWTLSNTWVYTFIRQGTLKHFLLQSNVVPSLRYGCEFWGMPSPCGEAKKA